METKKTSYFEKYFLMIDQIHLFIYIKAFLLKMFLRVFILYYLIEA